MGRSGGIKDREGRSGGQVLRGKPGGSEIYREVSRYLGWRVKVCRYRIVSGG